MPGAKKCHKKMMFGLKTVAESVRSSLVGKVYFEPAV
jgi:hypothetical protein